MIRDLATMLESFIKQEKKLLEKYHIINHPGMIGDMYEGMTREVLKKAIIPDLDLRVVSGKILKHDKTLSKQMDCMLVFGEGDKIPYTEDYIYKKSQVIATLEVKKNLFTNQLAEAYENLNSYRGLTIIDEEFGDEEERMINEALCGVFYGREIGKRGHEYPPTLENAYYNIIADACSPLKIVFAYDGVKTEEQLRSSVLKIVDSAFLKPGYQPNNFPDLIVCNQNCIIKTNGIPLAIPFLVDDTWPFYCSSDSNPILFLLELIWHRLDFLYGIPKHFFEPGVQWNALTFFLGARFVKDEDKEGWLIVHYPMDMPVRNLYSHEDDPVELNFVEFETLARLLKGEVIDVQTDDKLQEYFKENWVSFSIFAQQLANKELILINNTAISLRSDSLLLFISDNRFFAGDPKKQKLQRWLP